MCGLFYLRNRHMRFEIQTTLLKAQVVWDVMQGCKVGIPHTFNAKSAFIFRI
jgi:hypothetical protein